MSFLNVVLAFGALAFAVPLVIHLLTRSRFQQVEWGAMHLLEDAVSVNSRRMRLEQFLLLLLRCLIPFLLALTLARPVMTGWQTLAGNAPRSMVVVLDDSYSMEAGSVGQTSFDRARAAAKEIVGSLAPGSEVAVITTGGSATSITDRPTYDLPGVQQQIETLTPGSGSNRMSAALNTGVGILAGMTHAQRDLVLLSDFQRRDWQQLGGAEYESLAAQAKQLPIRPHVALLPLQPADGLSNVAIRSLDLSRTWLSIGQVVDARVNLQNDGEKAYDGAELELWIDDQREESKRINLSSNATAQAEFSWQFEEAGSHSIEVRLVVQDGLLTDNRRAAEVSVLPQLTVLLVDGDRKSEPLQSETDYLAIALAPFAFGGVSAKDAFATDTLRPDELNEARLKPANVVVLANVHELSPPQTELLKKFVSDGGCLIIAPGHHIKREWYNRALHDDGRGLMPITYGERRGDPQKPDDAVHISNQRFEHAALAMFNRSGGRELQAASIRAWYPMELPKTDAPEHAQATATSATPATAPSDPSTTSTTNSVSVMIRLDNSDPLLAEKRTGKGTVYQFAIPCDADWSDLPSKPVYLPLMQQLIAQAYAATTPNRNAITGDRLAEVLDEDFQGESLELIMPGGFRRTLAPVIQEGRKLFEFGQTQRPGVYQAQLSKDESVRFAVTSPQDESDLESLDAAGLKTLAENLGADLASDLPSYLTLRKESLFGREVWRWFLIGLLALMFGELAFQQWFTRGEAT